MEHLKLDQVLFNREQIATTSYCFTGGGTYLLIGQNGAGKTTLLESIAGMREIVAGEISIDAEPLVIKKRTRKQWNQRALVQTTIQIQHTEQYWTAEQLQQEQELQWRRELRSNYVEVKARLDHYYRLFGMDQHFQEQELQLLSVGQQKRAALALSFAKETSWLLLDEPLAALDEKGKDQLLAALKHRKSLGLSTIIVSHQTLELLPIVDHLILVEGLQLYDQSMPSYIEQQEMYEELVFSRLLAAERMYGEVDSLRANSKLSINEERVASSGLKTSNSISETYSATQIHSVFDPRAIIVAILLASSIIVYSNSWIVTIGYILIAIAILSYFKKSYKKWVGIIYSFAIMSVLFTLVGGLKLSPYSFDTESAIYILKRMMQLLTIVMLGLPIMELLTPFRLQRALEQSFSWLSKWKISIYPYTMLVSLIFRLVPLLLQKWNRTLAISRAKYNFSSTLSVRSFSLLLLPYLRGILRLADQIATSLELRGYSTDKLGEVMYYRVKWQKQDTILVTACIVLSAILLALSLAL